MKSEAKLPSPRFPHRKIYSNEPSQRESAHILNITEAGSLQPDCSDLPIQPQFSAQPQAWASDGSSRRSAAGVPALHIPLPPPHPPGTTRPVRVRPDRLLCGARAHHPSARTRAAGSSGWADSDVTAHAGPEPPSQARCVAPAASGGSSPLCSSPPCSPPPCSPPPCPLQRSTPAPAIRSSGLAQSSRLEWPAGVDRWSGPLEPACAGPPPRSAAPPARDFRLPGRGHCGPAGLGAPLGAAGTQTSPSRLPESTLPRVTGQGPGPFRARSPPPGPGRRRCRAGCLYHDSDNWPVSSGRGPKSRGPRHPGRVSLSR